MKTLIAYYSRNGWNAKVAQLAQERLGGDIDEIKDMKRRVGLWGFFIGGYDALRRRTTVIEFARDPAGYDLVVIAAPVWAGLIPPAARTYIKQNGATLGRLAFLSVSGQGGENAKVLPDLEAVTGRPLVASLLLKEADVAAQAGSQKLDAFCARLRS